MTQNQFEKLQTNFALYAKVETTYKASSPYSNGKKLDYPGSFMGIGVGANTGRIILAHAGTRMAIPFEDVKLPKLAWEC